ncbi:ribonuclease H-like domain, reverse transcriptase, RNA-dependent DNA polymerase [Tanacetum coccineum]
MWNTLTTCLNFSNSNNDVEYEALLAGLRIATEMQVKDIHAFVDSKLVASQVEFQITHIPRAENRKTGALNKLAADQQDDLIQELLEKGILREDLVEARTLMEKIRNYTLEDWVLYKKSYLVPLMRLFQDGRPNITIEEYIMLEEEKAQKRGKVFNWETAKYGKIWNDEDIHDLRSVETDFPAITFSDKVSSKTLSCEPTVNMALPSREPRHLFLRYEGLQYTEADIEDFEMRLTRIYRREVHRVQVFDFGGLPNLMAEGLSGRMLMEHRDRCLGTDTPYLLDGYGVLNVRPVDFIWHPRFEPFVSSVVVNVAAVVVIGAAVFVIVVALVVESLVRLAKVRIYQKSQENSQKRASTDTRIRKVQKEAKDSKPKPEMSNPQSTLVNHGQ